MHRTFANIWSILLVVLTLSIFYQLSWLKSTPVASQASNYSETAWLQGDQEPQNDPKSQGDPNLQADQTLQADRTLQGDQNLQGDQKPQGDQANNSISSVDYSKIHISHGETQCMPDFNTEWKQRATKRKESCAKHAPFDTHENRRVAFATITTGKPTEAYDGAIRSQMLHAAVHETSVHILCEQLVDGVWNKIAFLLNLVMNEMLKPEESRLEWILWIDRDAIILDPCRPLSSFLPPNTPEFDKVNLITNRDAIGLNAGVFFFRVNHWSIHFFNTILAYRYYRPDEYLSLAEQTAMDKLLEEARWQGKYVQVPRYWFNAYPAPKDSIKNFAAGNEPDDLMWFQARKGDFVVHFAGDDERSERMKHWLKVVEDMDVWEAGDAKMDITAEIQEYWESYRQGNLTKWQLTGDPKYLAVP